MDSVSLYPGLNTPLWQYGQQDSSSGAPVYVDSATITAALVDQFGNSLGPYTYTFVSGPQTGPDGTVYPDGNYRAIIPYNAAILPSSLYLGTISITIGGVTQTEHFEAASSLCAGQYSDTRYWQRFEGQINVRIFSDKDDSGAADACSILSAMLWADGQINEFFSGHYAIPLSFNSGSVSETVKRWATVLGIGQWLYFSRGQYDAKGADPVGDRWTGEVAKIWQEMDEYRGPWRRLPCAPATGIGRGTAPACVPQTVNPDGSPHASRPPYPVVRWDGYWWRW